MKEVSLIITLAIAVIWTHAMTIPPTTYKVIDLGVGKPTKADYAFYRKQLVRMFKNAGIEVNQDPNPVSERDKPKFNITW